VTDDNDEHPRRLIARSRRLALDAPIDLLTIAGDRGLLWQQGPTGFAGYGIALSIEVPAGEPAEAARAVHESLDVIAVDDRVERPGSGPIALGALPFDPRLPGRLVVPQVVIGQDVDGAQWITTVAFDDDDDDDVDRHIADVLALASPPVGESNREPDAAANSFTITTPRSPEDWCDAVKAIREDLRKGAIQKVVLARELLIEGEAPINRIDILDQLRRAFPTCMIFADQGFIGASPELLVSRIDDIVISHPMAGTAPRGADPETDAALAANLRTSSKDLVEHRYTIDMVHDTLLPWCSYLDEDAEPTIVALANVQHLATRVTGQLSTPPASVIELMRALHPTPAVNGAPRAEALELIERYEKLDRGRYAGPVGWVDRNGNGSWAVGIRSAVIDGREIRIYAGVGVVADSEPELELAETEAKFQAMIGAIIRQ